MFYGLSTYIGYKHKKGLSEMKNKDLSTIRHNIMKRKQKKKRPSTIQASNTVMYKQKKDRPFSENNTPHVPQRSFQRRFLIKTFLATTLFFASTLLLTNQDGWLEKPHQFTKQLYTVEFPFATVNAWYQAKFGAPLALQQKQINEEEPLALPVSGEISQTFQENGEGVLISSAEEKEVVAIQSGTVLFAGKDRETGNTIILQHEDRSKSIYGNLSTLDVHSYQSIEANQAIGTFEPEAATDKMYFAIEKNQQFMDPIQVIKVDDQS